MGEERKIVSVLFADLVGSTALGHENDPEVVRTVLERYFDRVTQIAETHGGTVEKFAGDAVMAVFGVPRLHDDDAERAVRAALAIRDAIPSISREVALELEARIGVNTGEAVAAVDERRQRLVTGDFVNVAARLQQNAAPGEVIVGQLTELLTRGAIEYERIAPIQAHGKPVAVTAYRALRPRTRTPDQARGLPHMRARLVGRNRELQLLLETFERARETHRAQLFTIAGSAGVGKSRLVGEFLARVGTEGEVRALRGRCLPYGTGITYWPLLELVHADLEVAATETRGEVLGRLEARISELIPDGADRPAVRSRVSVLLGLADATETLPDVAAARLPSEIAWGIARYMEGLADRMPVVVVIDDLQWAEPPVIESVRAILDRGSDARTLAVCIARPELLEKYPTWGAGQANSTLIVLDPLTQEETRTLIGRLLDVDDLPEELRAALIERAGGNPLFCEEFVRMLIDEGRLVRVADRWQAAESASLDVRVPESIQSLLGARLDALPAAAKRLAQAASVIGEEFDASHLVAIAGDEDAPAALDPLARGGFVVADRRAGRGRYRFRHLLIRDVAYSSLPKIERARLHDAFGRHLEVVSADRRDELIEILAHHAERSLSLLRELRQSGPEVMECARRAFDLTLVAAERALERGNAPAATSLLASVRKAVSALQGLTEEEEATLLLLEGSRAALVAEYDAARGALPRAAELAISAGRPDLAARSNLALAAVLTFAQRDDSDLVLWEAAIETAITQFDEDGNVAGRVSAQLLALEPLFGSGRFTQMIEEGNQLAETALEAGEPSAAASVLARLVSAATWLGEARMAQDFFERAMALSNELGLLSTARYARFFRARLDWAMGRFSEAEAASAKLVDEAYAAGEGQMVVSAARLLGETLLAQGRVQEADAAFSMAVDRSVSIDERWSRSELLAFRGICATRRGDLQAAEWLLDECAATIRGIDTAAISQYNEALAELRIAQRRDDEAEAALRRAVGVIRETEHWSYHRVSLQLAEFLLIRGRTAEAAELVSAADRALAGAEITLVNPHLDRLRQQLAPSDAGASPRAAT